MEEKKDVKFAFDSVSEMTGFIIKPEPAPSEGAHMRIELKHRITGSVLFSIEADSLRVAVETAVRQKTDLSFVDLYRADLEGADLEGANLKEAYFEEANLYGANLTEADLEGANLKEADLEKAYLYRANLVGANLVEANLYGAYLHRADLERAYLYKADLERANLREANLKGAYLKEADLGGADLTGAYLERVDLERVDLERVDLEGPNLEGAYFEDSWKKLKLVGRRPLLIIGPIGSRSDYLNAILTDHGVYVKTGCFFDALDKFKQAVERNHGSNEHGKEYTAAIALIEVHADLWTPKADEV